MLELQASTELRRSRSLSRWLTCTSFAAVATIMLSIVFAAHMAYQDTGRDAARSAGNIVTFLQSELESSIEVYNVALRGLRTNYGRPVIAALPPEERDRFLFDWANTTRYMGSMAVADVSGNVVAQSSDSAFEAPNVADRDYFTAQKDRAEDRLFISRPLDDHTAGGEPVIVLSLRRTRTDGAFDGVVFGNVKLSYLHDLLGTAQVGENGHIGLYRTDGIELMHNIRGPADPDIGTDASGNPVLRQMLDAPSGSLEGAAGPGEARYLYLFARIGEFPLMISVGLSVESIYRQWRSRAAVMLTVTGLACFAILALTGLFRRELLRRALAEAELTRLATTDGLTGIPNRRRFDQLLAREWRRSVRTGQCLAVLMIDVDSFKLFNDLHGHWLGDELLAQIAASISTALRHPADIAARYGGEEFAVILPGTDLEGALVIAETIRSRIADAQVRDAAGTLLATTASIGVCGTWPSPRTSAAELVQAADGALYQAKNLGRNRVAAVALAVPQVQTPGLPELAL